MDTQTSQRLQWEIDRVLERLVGCDVRVAARAFAVPGGDRLAWSEPIDVRNLFLPDNTQPGGVPVHFEGLLLRFERQLGVVFVWLDGPSEAYGAPDGQACFRGRQAVILRGPAMVELAFPFRIERLPSDPDNYWRDLRVPRAQLEFTFL